MCDCQVNERFLVRKPVEIGKYRRFLLYAIIMSTAKVTYLIENMVI